MEQGKERSRRRCETLEVNAGRGTLSGETCELSELMRGLFFLPLSRTAATCAVRSRLWAVRAYLRCEATSGV